MCGRFSFSASREKVNKQLGLAIKMDLKPSYNIAPSQMAYLVTQEKPRDVQRMSWGLIPHWSNSVNVGANLINARREGIESKPSFRIPIRKKRCLILADGFYEWKKQGREKKPYRIVLKNNHLMAFAGIWDLWINPSNNVPVSTFSIITCPPNAEMSEVHNRMPVIFREREMMQQWMAEQSLQETLELLQPVENGSLDVFPVSPKANKPSYNEPDLYERIKLPPTLFD